LETRGIASAMRGGGAGFALAARGHAASTTARGISSTSKAMGQYIDDDDDDEDAEPKTKEELEEELNEKIEDSYRTAAHNIRNSPMKRKMSLYDDALTGATSVRPFLEEADVLGQEEDKEVPRELMARVIDVNRTNKVTKGGGLTSYTALVVVGNGDGICGFSTGKGKDIGVAIDKAYVRAIRSLVHIERFDKHTVYHPVTAKHCKTKIIMEPRAKGKGLMCNQVLQSICEMAGITNLMAKVIGSHHPHNTVRAAFEALESMQTPEAVAGRLDVHMYKI